MSRDRARNISLGDRRWKWTIGIAIEASNANISFKESCILKELLTATVHTKMRSSGLSQQTASVLRLCHFKKAAHRKPRKKWCRGVNWRLRILGKLSKFKILNFKTMFFFSRFKKDLPGFLHKKKKNKSMNFFCNEMRK